MMKKIILGTLLLAVAMIVNAVPAKRGWITYTQSDGSTIELQQFGDEFYHYMINRDGKQVRENENGMYEVVGDAPTAEQVAARREVSKARRAMRAAGVTPNLAPRGIVIIANFKDTKLNASHTQAVFDELCNSENCTVNSGYPSAAQYFSNQSNGSYHPQFDVYGPVTLQYGYAHYGKDLKGYEAGTDTLAADAVVEACILAHEEYNIDFSQYDSDNDNFVDFVYLIYAGKGQADGGNSSTIWPHNWEVNSARAYGMCSYSYSQCFIGNRRVNNYACSSELSGSALCGIGTLCHEFGHVMGLPDFYDTNYGSNYTNDVTPNEWDVMDAGAYNGSGHCPPNYSPWEKYFFGWKTPENLGSTPRRLSLVANGKEGYNCYQINSKGTQQTPTSTGVCYFIENRQKQGWDYYLPASGMLIWKVDFNASAWSSNAPNNTAGNPRYTLIIPNGTRIGKNYGTQNVWPYKSGSTVKDSWSDVTGKPLLEITKSGSLINLIYIKNPIYTVTWMVNGEVLETVEYPDDGSADLAVPTKTVTPCEGTELIGWTKEEQWLDPFVEPEDLFVEPSGKVTGNVVYHAVFR